MTLKAKDDPTKKDFWLPLEAIKNDKDHYKGRVLASYIKEEIPVGCKDFMISLKSLEKLNLTELKILRKEAACISQRLDIHYKEFLNPFIRGGAPPGSIEALYQALYRHLNKLRHWLSKIEKAARVVIQKIDSPETCLSLDDIEGLKGEKDFLQKEIKELEGEQRALIKEIAKSEASLRKERGKAEKTLEKAKEDLISTKKKEERQIEKAVNQSQTILNNAEAKALAIESVAKESSKKVVSDARERAEFVESEARRMLTNVNAHLDKPALEFYVEAFLSRLSEVRKMAIKDRAAMLKLYMAMKDALGRIQGVKPTDHNDLNRNMYTGHKIDALYRFYSAKIKEVKEDHGLDEDVKSAQILGLTETMERQVQALSGALEADI